jgi:cellulose synthase/poly-beta-1,6-N-acetylglucosamine synthase-like glycosyltransferase
VQRNSDPGNRLPSIPAGGFLRESPARRYLIRTVALLAIAITAGYLAWRVTSTIDLGIWWLAIPLFAVEVHNAFGLVLYTFALWEVGEIQPAQPARAVSPRKVAVMIPTYNEPVEVLLPTVAAAVALRPAHETWVLDDGNRPAVRRLARDLGARYLARTEHSHAKAGNLNHALSVVEADVVAILDADHVPSRDFLAHTLGYFADPSVALVQTPQSFYNLESFEHAKHGDAVYNEESVFYRVIAPAKNRWAAPFWCGTGALVRVAALRSVGGVATESVTEDIHTTIRMYRAGWKGVYHNEILANGLAPSDAEAYLTQRNRWATGAMQVLRMENPLFGPGLSFGQRVAFMTTLFAWFDAWRMLAYMVIPVAVIFTATSPISAPVEVFGPLFLLTLGSQFIALRLLARGHYPPILSMLFEVLRMPAVLPATLTIFRRDASVPFKVTPKGRSVARGGRVPLLHAVLLAASALAVAWLTLSALGLTPMHYTEPGAAIGAGFFAAMNLGLLIAAISRIRASRFAGERRASVRFDTRLPATLSGRKAIALDLSLTGTQVVLTGRPKRIAARPTLRLDVERETIALACIARRVLPQADGSVMIGLEFAPGQRQAIRQLALAMFGAEVSTWRRVVAVPRAEPARTTRREVIAAG